MATTPTFGWRFQALSDPPNGAILGENLALDAEGTVVGINTRLTTAEADIVVLEAVDPYRAEHVTTGTEASVVFSGIPATLKTVRISYTARGDTAAVSVDVYARINADSSALYAHVNHFQANNTPGAFSAAGATSAQVGTMAGASATAGRFGGGVVEFVGWNSPHASCLIAEGSAGIVSAAGSCVKVAATFTYTGAGPYTSITLLPVTGSFVIGSGFYLVGER